MMRQRLPEWLKRGIINTDTTQKVRRILRKNKLNTVCDSARCPNKNECYSKNTATFMILGNTCTRNCRFCNVNGGIPETINKNEPELIAKAIKDLELDYVVITSVTRDDLPDGGANHFAETVKAVKSANQNVKVELLTPDFKGQTKLIDIIIESRPDVFNHNIETVKRLYPQVRPQAIYERSLDFIKYIKNTNPNIHTKSGIMVGLGETFEEITGTINDLHKYKCDIITVGQYIQPSNKHLQVKKYLKPEEFQEIEKIARESGIKHIFSGPLVRSSYKAKEIFSTN